MEQDTLLTSMIESSDDKKMYDLLCKRLISNKIILAWIMKRCASEYKDSDVEKIASTYIEGNPIVSSINIATGELIIGANTESSGMNEGKITYDIRYCAIAPKGDGFVGLLINMEAQNDYYPGYPVVKRGVFHSSRMISQQYGIDFDKVDYNKLKKVYSIWLLRNVAQKVENSITSYDLAETTHIGHAGQPKDNYDLISVVMIYLGSDPDDKQPSD